MGYLVLNKYIGTLHRPWFYIVRVRGANEKQILLYKKVYNNLTNIVHLEQVWILLLM